MSNPTLDHTDETQNGEVVCVGQVGGSIDREFKVLALQRASELDQKLFHTSVPSLIARVSHLYNDIDQVLHWYSASLDSANDYKTIHMNIIDGPGFITLHLQGKKHVDILTIAKSRYPTNNLRAILEHPRAILIGTRMPEMIETIYSTMCAYSYPRQATKLRFIDLAQATLMEHIIITDPGVAMVVAKGLIAQDEHSLASMPLQSLMLFHLKSALPTHLPTLDRCDFTLGQDPNVVGSINGQRINSIMMLHTASLASASLAILNTITGTLHMRPDDLASFHGSSGLTNGYIERCAMIISNTVTDSDRAKHNEALQRMNLYERKFRVAQHDQTLADLRSGRSPITLDLTLRRDNGSIGREWMDASVDGGIIDLSLGQ